MRISILSLLLVVLPCMLEAGEANVLSNRRCEGAFGYVTRVEDADRLIKPGKLKHTDSFLKPFTELFEFIEKKEYPFSIADDFSHYRVVVEDVIRRGNVQTKFISFETRILMPEELADLAKAGRIRGVQETFDLQDFVARENHAYSPHTYVALLHRLQSNGLLGHLQQAALELEQRGRAELLGSADPGLSFYLKEIARRSWPNDMKANLTNEFWDTLPYSVFSVSTLVDTGEVIGTLQTIRAPYGVRTVSRGPMGENLLDARFGDWGPSFRKLAYLHPEEMVATDLELFNFDNQNLSQLGPDGSPWFHFIPPVERKMRSNGLDLQREIFTEAWSDEYQDQAGNKVYVHWGAGEVNEHARFAIRRDLNKTLFAEVYLQLFANAIDADSSDPYNLLYRSYWTYNDLPKLYEWAGYRSTGQTINIDGRGFHVLSATGYEHVRALLNFSHATNPFDEALLKRLDEMYRHYGDQRFQLRGRTL